MMELYGLRNRNKVYLSERKKSIHKVSGCRVDGEGVNEIVNVQNIPSWDVNGGWSMIEIALVSRCIIGA